MATTLAEMTAERDALKREMHDIYLISIGLDPKGEPDPERPKSTIVGHMAWAVMKMASEIKELKPLAHAYQLAKLDAVWSDPRFAVALPTKGKWKLRYNQPDIFLLEIRKDHGDNAVLFEKDGKWVGAEQHYPTPFINDQKTFKHVGDAMIHALKVAEWKP